MKSVLVLAAAAALVLHAGLAWAGAVVTPPSFSLDVTSSVGHDVLNLRPTLTENPDGSFSVHGDEAAPSFSIVFDLVLNADPSLFGSFTLVNLSGANQTFTVSATLGGLAAIPATTMAGFYGPATYTDLNDEYVTLSSTLFYQARIDGTGIKDLGNFSENASGGPGVVQGETSNESFGPEGGVGVAPGGSIGVGFGFGLTAHDQVEVPFGFAVVPEPEIPCLFAVMAGIFLARAARKSTRLSNSLW